MAQKRYMLIFTAWSNISEQIVNGTHPTLFP